MDIDTWMDLLEIDFVNGELDLIADEIKSEEIDQAYNEMIEDLVCIKSSELEASHVGA